MMNASSGISPLSLIFILFVFSSLLILLARLRRSKDIGSNAEISLPTPPPHPPRAERAFNAVLLLLTAITLFTWVACNRGTGGILPDIATVSAAVARPFLLALGFGLSCALLGAYLAYRGATATAVVMTAAGAIISGWVINGGLHQFSYPDQRVWQTRQVLMSFESSEKLPDLELWCNGEKIGILPVVMPMEKFLAKAPSWQEEEPPGETISFHRNPSEQSHPRELETWFPLAWPEQTDFRKYGAYYCRLRRSDGEWLPGRMSGGGHGTAGRSTYQVGFTLLPEEEYLQSHIEPLLDSLRARDFAVDEQLLGRLDQWGHFGFKTIVGMQQQESQWNGVLQSWAKAHYGPLSDLEPDRALDLYRTLQQEADQNRSYRTDSLQGWTLEKIADSIPSSVIEKEALNWLEAMRHGRFFYQYFYQARPAAFGVNAVSQATADQPLPPSAFVTAHAVWAIRKGLDPYGADREHYIFTKIAPELLRQKHEEIALQLGGPAVNRYLARQNWYSDPDIAEDNLAYVHGQRVNKWFKFLVSFDGPAGVEFREQHRQEIYDFVSNQLRAHPWDLDITGFLFDARTKNGKPLAWDYWPIFRQMRFPQAEELYYGWNYLARLEPDTPLEWYLDAWKRHPDQWYAPGYAESALSKLPVSRRIEIMETILDWTRDLEPFPSGATQSREAIVQDLESRITALQRKREE
jgi:hypothetical protein